VLESRPRMVLPSTIGGKWDQVGTILATDGHYRIGVHVLSSERSHLWDLPPIHHHASDGLSSPRIRRTVTVIRPPDSLGVRAPNQDRQRRPCELDHTSPQEFLVTLLLMALVLAMAGSGIAMSLVNVVGLRRRF